MQYFPKEKYQELNNILRNNFVYFQYNKLARTHISFTNNGPQKGPTVFLMSFVFSCIIESSEWRSILRVFGFFVPRQSQQYFCYQLTIFFYGFRY